MLNLTTVAPLLQRTGVYGPVTATLDWCELNHQFSPYIAEMANTFSNLFTVLLALAGYREACREKLPTRYGTGYLGIALVGIGSFFFHATLLFEAQLADELPMIYVGSMSLFLLFDTKSGFSIDTSRSRALMVALALFDVLFTWSYMVSRNPIYHQLVFAGLVIGTAARVAYILNNASPSGPDASTQSTPCVTSTTLASPSSTSQNANETRPVYKPIPPKKKSTIAAFFSTGAGLFALGFLVWNLDNIFCGALTKWKVGLGWPMAFLLEGHSWWHVLTGLGTYYMFIGIQCE
ncbi:hypothetical protein D9619_002616 [Psilocybe cf. subviscida]|uniref:Alkaline phytoceramidase n=1 Tax=Psilocybe cf. subviscida TaxID=2480587 RepID=A0A8H5AYQ0_9AGAR|nr:hypothetical protein D9619_002616 [Psilocybe cf. subviscida]